MDKATLKVRKGEGGPAQAGPLAGPGPHAVQLTAPRGAKPKRGEPTSDAMPAYVVAQIEVTDPARYAKYMELGGASVLKHGGRFVVRGGGAEGLEGAWLPKRMAVIEFPSRAAAKAWWDSADYQHARTFRLGAARFEAVLVDGYAGVPGTP